MRNGANEEKIERILAYYQHTKKPLKECIRIVEPDIKVEVLEKIFKSKKGEKNLDVS